MSTCPIASQESALAQADVRGVLLECVTLLVRRRRFVLAATLICTLAGALGACLLPNLYAGVVKLMPPQQNQSSALALLSQLSSATGGGLAAAAGRSLLKDPNELYVGIARSRPVADSLITRFSLMSRYGAHDMTGARQRLAEATTVASSKDGIITIVVEDRDAKVSAELANGYVSALTGLVNSLALTEASQRRVFYDRQVEQAKHTLDQAESALKATQLKTGVVQLETQAKAQVELAEGLRQRIAAKQVELQGLKTFATTGNIEVQMTQQELNALEVQLRRADQNRNEGDPLDLGLRKIPDVQSEYLKSLREFKFRETLFEFLTKQLEASKLDEARDVAIIQVIEPAIPAERKSSPNRALITLLSFACGLCFFSLLVLALEPFRSEATLKPYLDELRQTVSAARMFR